MQSLEASRWVPVVFNSTPHPGLLSSVPVGHLGTDLMPQILQAHRGHPQHTLTPMCSLPSTPFHRVTQSTSRFCVSLLVGC